MGVLKEVPEYFDLISLLTDFDERSDVNRGALILHNIIRSVHVDVLVTLLERCILVPSDVVSERFL